MSNAPVILFTYNRPDHTQKTVEALGANGGARESDLVIYSDGPKREEHRASVMAVRDYLRTITGFGSVSIVERPRNMGLAASVIAGVSEVLERHGRAIVVEDDMITAPDFLSFMNEALTVYQGRPDIFSVTGYNYPLAVPADYRGDAYLSYRSSSWGWGTWADRWQQVDWAMSDYHAFAHDDAALKRFARGGDDLFAMLKLQMEGKLDSWSIRFDYAHYKHDATCLHPVRSRLRNIGFDGSGVHCDVSNEYDVELDSAEKPFLLPPDLEIDPVMLRVFNDRFRPSLAGGARLCPSPVIPLKRRIKSLIQSVSLGTWKT